MVLVENLLHWQPQGSESGVTLLNTVPSVLREILVRDALPGSIRCVNLAGEALGTSMVQQIYAVGTVERVCNLYGPSETTTYSTWQVVEADEQRPPIGRPIAYTQAYVLDQWMQQVAAGGLGELYLGGRGVARGYMGQPI